MSFPKEMIDLANEPPYSIKAVETMFYKNTPLICRTEIIEALKKVIKETGKRAEWELENEDPIFTQKQTVTLAIEALEGTIEVFQMKEEDYKQAPDGIYFGELLSAVIHQLLFELFTVIDGCEIEINTKIRAIL